MRCKIDGWFENQNCMALCDCHKDERNMRDQTSIDLERHGADKASQALHDVIDLTDDFGTKLRVSLMAAGATIAIASAVLGEKMRREGHACSDDQAKEYLFKLLQTTTIDGADAAWSMLNAN
jgi:hypothetical protein